MTRPVRVEIPKIKGSRFIADLSQAGSAADADRFVARVREEFPDARHHCFAWRVGRGGDTFRYSDDGEPSGTAGRPILQHLEGGAVTDAVLVVTRYFGGTKLGVGGLIRAYGAAAAAVLAEAELEPLIDRRDVVVRFDYPESGAVSGFLSAHGLEPSASRYGAEIELVFAIPESDVRGLVDDLRERTGGRAQIEIRAHGGRAGS
ncbi:MAG: YigZ family protein [Gemmatimonadota bacterium]